MEYVFILAMIGIIGYAGYLLLTAVVAPLLSLLSLMLVGAWGMLVTTVAARYYFNPGVASVPGETRLQYSLRRRQAKKPDISEDQVMEEVAKGKYFFIGFHLASLVIVLVYLTNPLYQIAPFNYMGFVAAILVLFAIARTAWGVMHLDENKLKPRPSPVSRGIDLVLTVSTGLLLTLYAIGVMAIKAGVV